MTAFKFHYADQGNRQRGGSICKKEWVPLINDKKSVTCGQCLRRLNGTMSEAKKRGNKRGC